MNTESRHKEVRLLSSLSGSGVPSKLSFEKLTHKRLADNWDHTKAVSPDKLPKKQRSLETTVLEELLE